VGALIGANGLVVWLVVAVGSLYLPVRTLVDVAQFSRAAFYGAGYSRTGWIALIAAGIALWPVGLVASAIYWLRARPRVRDVARELAEA
jgi:hypothetical protein